MTVIPDSDLYTDEELLKMTRKEAIEGLSEKAQRFCEFYIEDNNKKMAMLKAGYSSTLKGVDYGTMYAYKLLRDERVRRYIMWLKVRLLKENFLKASEIIDEWIRIAFADMTDFVDIYPNYIKLKPANSVDGQLIKSIKSGRDGISIELHDKMKALDNLAKYCKDMPKEWKQKLEERRQELLEQEFEFKKKAFSIENPVVEDDGFIEAIKQSAETIWEN